MMRYLAEFDILVGLVGNTSHVLVHFEGVFSVTILSLIYSKYFDIKRYITFKNEYSTVLLLDCNIQYNLGDIF